MTINDIIAGDIFESQGGRRVAGFGGTVTKANRVTLEVESLYMGRIPQKLKVKRSDLEGRVLVKRGETIYTINP